jgi:hypothetical protein
MFSIYEPVIMLLTVYGIKEYDDVYTIIKGDKNE